MLREVFKSTNIVSHIKYQQRLFMEAERAPNGDGEEKPHRTGTRRKVKS